MSYRVEILVWEPFKSVRDERAAQRAALKMIAQGFNARILRIRPRRHEHIPIEEPKKRTTR